MRTTQEVEHAFTPNRKLSPGQVQKVLNAEVAFRDFAKTVIMETPDCADRTSALRKILEAKMMVTQAITHQKSPEEALVKAPKEAVNVQSQT